MQQHRDLAAAHVDWYLKSIRPLLIDNFVHGIKHGIQMAIDEALSGNKNEDWVEPDFGERR